MNIFINRKNFSVRKIKKVVDGWKLYPTNSNETSVFISEKNYSGRMPPFFRWPWQTLELELTLVNDFQISAVLGGYKLFEISEKDYPPEIKKLLERGDELYQKAMITAKERDISIKKALKAYLKDVALIPNLENELSTLKVCLRVYMKMHLFKGPSGQDYMQRLNLMMLICKIAQRIYTRHVDEKATFGIVMAFFEYTFRCNFPHYEDCVEDYEKIVKEQKRSEKIFELYREVDGLMGEILPPINNDSLKRYLNYLTRQVLSVFSDDMAYLDCNHLRDAWGKRIDDDEGDYKELYKEMKMLKFESFLLPEVFTDEVICDFIHSYNLK